MTKFPSYSLPSHHFELVSKEMHHILMKEVYFYDSFIKIKNFTKFSKNAEKLDFS